jgi:hypothetical protein
LNLDESLNQFRLASRELFNHYFRVSTPYDNTETAHLQAERFARVQDALFEAFVGHYPTVPYGEVQTHIEVKLQTQRAPAMLNREVDSGYWDHPLTELSGDARMVFISFFDWDQLSYRDNQYVRARIVDYSSRPDVIGRDVLIESQYVTFVRRYHPTTNADDTP